MKQSRNRAYLTQRTRAILAIGALLILGLAVDALLIEPYRLVVEEVEIPLQGLPSAMDGLRIAQLSDLHITSMGAYERQVQARVARLQPDLVVITGDLIEHVAAYNLWAEQAKEIHEFLSGLNAPLGVWASRGNTDISRYGGHSAILVDEIGQGGARVLINAHVDLTRYGSSITLAGADYAHLPDGFSTDHKVVSDGENMALVAEACEGNAFSHYMPETWPDASSHSFSGRFMYTDPEGGVGLVFASRQPLGEDSFLRLRRLPDKPEWHLAPKGATVTEGSWADSLEPEPGVWYRFRVQWTLKSNTTHVQARLWPAEEPEPLGWGVDCRLNAAIQGTVGFWSVGPGEKYLDDVALVAQGAEITEWREDFESFAAESDPPHWLDFGVNTGNVAQAMRLVDSNDVSILLAHSPDAIHEGRESGADLVLSGHTHGGQIRLPWIGPIYVNTELDRKYNQGLFQFGETWLYINRGMGTRGLPIRFLCPPEITLITLRRHP